MEFAATFIGLAIAGLFVGICSGLLGIGGGTLMVPLLKVVFGLSAHAATATSLFTIIPTSLSGAVSHLRNQTCFPKLGIALGLGGSLTSALGVYLSSLSPSWAIMLVAAIIIFYSAYTMLRKAIKLPSGKNREHAAESEGNRRGQSDPLSDCAPSLTGKTLLAGVGIGMIAGLCAGYVGVGGGFLMVPLMTSVLHVPMKQAPGTSTVAIIILSIPGVIGQALLGNIDYLAGIMLALGSIPGAAIGAKLTNLVNERQLRFIFAVFLLVAGILLLVK